MFRPDHDLPAVETALQDTIEVTIDPLITAAEALVRLGVGSWHAASATQSPGPELEPASLPAVLRLQSPVKIMAMMFPARLGPKAAATEAAVWERLASLPDEWNVIRTKRFSIPSRLSEPVEGEIDYLVIDPARGCVGLEAIYGRCPRWVESTWYQKNEQGFDVEVESPGQRARLAVHKLSQYLGTQPAFRDWKRHPSFGWGVVMPDGIVSGELGPDLSRSVMVDRNDLDNFRYALDTIFRAHAIDGPPIDQIRLDVLIGILTKAS